MTTKIEWTEKTWNPVRGCSRISPGCENCYAERIAARFSTHAMQDGDEDGGVFAGFAKRTASGPRWTGRVELIPEKLTEPLHWRKPRRVFVNSMSDLFHENLPDEAIDQVFAAMALCPHHTFQMLTKRAKRMREWFETKPQARVEDIAGREIVGVNGPAVCLDWPLPNVHLGVSVESQKYADERIPELLATPAAVRWVSAEPLLEAVNLTAIRRHLQGNSWEQFSALDPKDDLNLGQARAGLDWIVVGGESGPDARPFNIAWARSIVSQCKAAGVACFVKQLGACITGLNLEGPPCSSPPRREGFLVHWTNRELNIFGLCDRKGGNPEEWPSDLRVREYPL